MQDSPFAFNGNSSNDMVNMTLDFEGIMAQDPSLNRDLDPFATGLHDDSCLDHNVFSHCNPAPKAHPNFSTQIPTSQPQRNSAQAHSRQRHSISNPASVQPVQDASFSATWDSIFSDALLSQPGNCGGFDICKDDHCDSASCSSECAGSCPSQCADQCNDNAHAVCCDDDAAHAVCCDDDACAPADLCLDNSCHVAAAPCTKNECSISNHEAAAAAALTSFGGKDAAMSAPGMLATSQAMAPLDPGDLTNLGLPAVPCSSLSLDDGPLSNMSGFDQIWGIPSEFILANHIVQYHDPTQHAAHPGQCVADNPSSVVAMCSLPKFSPTGQPHGHNHHLGDSVCGFEVHDPQTFAEHIFQQHRSALMQHGSFLPKDNSAPMAGYSSNGSFNGHHLSASASPNTNLSMGTSLSPTPVSLATPSPMDAPHYFLGLDPPKVEPTSISGNDQFTCRWIGHDGTACGHVSTGHKELQEHCKMEHLKEIKKDHAGFYCRWQGCTRHTTFSQRSKLERHMQVHTGFKPVECKICGAQLSAKQSLEQHMRTHTGEKPWVCTYPGCNQAFKQQSALTMHERTHTGAKPLKCDICGKKFGESSNLSKHRRIHNIRGSHVCEICGKDFHRLDQLRRHMGTNHKDRPDEVKKILSRVKSGRVTKSSNISISAASSDCASEMTESLKMEF